MPRFAGKDVKVYLGIGLLTIVTFVIYHVGSDICGQATEGYHTFRPETPVQLAG